MELAFPWMFGVLGVLLVIGAVAVVVLWRRASRGAGAAPRARVAHMTRLTRLPGYLHTVRRVRLATIAVVVVLAAGIAAAGVLSARPISTSVVEPRTASRDIVLCLDVSGSMIDVDIDLLERFDQLVDGFEGERIALVIFNSTAAQVFPLTDDYDYIHEQIGEVRAGLDGTGDFEKAHAGTENGPPDAGSLIGDGLSSCLLKFDRTDTVRSRSVVLATDNVINGEPILTLTEATAFARSLDVTVYGIDPAEQGEGTEAVSKEFEDALVAIDGEYFTLSSQATVGTIVDQIQATQAQALEDEQPQIVVFDHPVALGVLLLVLVTALLLLAWRARL